MSLPDLGPRYRIQRELGRGGMGIVYLADDLLYGRAVALKLLPPNISDPSVVRRFQREAGNLARLEHENIVRFYGVGECKGRVFFGMEYVDGPPVHAHLQDHPEPIRRALELAAQVAAALEHAHSRDVVHRDLKPENVLLDSSGRVRVMDFGLARRVSDTRRLTSTGAILGTAAYLSPEQAMGERAEPLSDLYSLGVVLYEWLCGRVPFEEDDPLAVVMAHLQEPPPPPKVYNQDIPEEVEDLLLQLLEKDRSHRPRSAAEVRVRLESWLGQGRPIRELRSGREEPALIGRVEELEAVLEAVEGATRPHGRGFVVRILGHPGMGKSRLLDEVEARLRPRRMLVVRARGRGGDGGALWSAVLGTLGSSGVDGAPDLREAVARARRALEEGCARWEDFRGRRVWLAALCRPFGHLPRGRRAVLLLDDLDEADGTAEAILSFLVGDWPAPPVAVVVTARSGECLGGLPPTACLDVELGPLGPEDRWRLAAEVGRSVPPSGCPGEILLGTVREPADPADPTLRLMLATVAALGEPVESCPLATLLGRSVPELRQPLDWCRAQGWLEEDPAGGWRFTSPSRRERARGLLPGTDSLEFHAEAARALRTNPRPWPPALARHAVLAGQDDEAALWTLEGALLRRRRLALGDACRDLGQVAGSSSTSSLGLERARTHLAAGQAEEAVHVAWGANPDEAGRGVLLRVLAEALSSLGRRREALEAARVAATGPRSAPERARSLLLMIRTGLEGEQALQAAWEAMEEADRSGDVVLAVDARLELARQRRIDGDHRGAVGVVEAALQLAAASDLPDLRVLTGLRRAALALESELDPDLCLARCRSVHAEAEEMKVGPWLGELHTLQGLAHSARGDWPAAEDAFVRALEVQQEHGLITEMDFSCSKLGEIAWIQGEPERARAYLEKSLQLAEEEGDQETFFLSKCGLGQLLLDQGQAVAARALFLEAVESARRSGNRCGEARARNLLSAAAGLEGRADSAEAEAGAALILALEAGDSLQAGLAHARTGMAFRLRGDHRAAREHLEQGLEEIVRAAAPYQQALVRTELAEVLCFGPTGNLQPEPDVQGGLEHLDEAARLFSQMNAFAALARVDRLQSRILERRLSGVASESR